MNGRLRFRRHLNLLAVLTLTLAAVAAPAHGSAANKPIREPLPAESFTVTDICPFDVLHEFARNNEYITTFFDQAGNPTMQLITGALKVRLTNLDTGKFLDVNISGPGRVEFGPDGSTIVSILGPAFVALYPDDLPDFSPRMFLSSGRVVFENDAEGNLISLNTSGNIQDICAALAD